jgi:hypothetical protein
MGHEFMYTTSKIKVTKGYDYKILESNFAAKRQRQFLRNFLSVEKEPKNKNGTHQRLLREGVKNDVSDKMKNE